MRNGSFEKGGDQPEGWHEKAGQGHLARETARHGEHYLSAKANGEPMAWESDVANLERGIEQRVEGWLRCRAGKAGLGVERLGQNGEVVDTIWSPWVSESPDWQYAAAETDGGPETRGRVVFSVEGDADLDNVFLAPVCISMIGNKGMEQDAPSRRGRQNRILMWIRSTTTL